MSEVGEKWYVRERKEKEKGNEKVEFNTVKVVNPNDGDFKTLLLDSVYIQIEA